MEKRRKIFVLNGSPKKERSTTMVATRAFVAGIEETGDYETEYLNVSDLNVKPCTGCLSCWGKTEGECAIKGDDVSLVKQKILGADIFIESYPLYFFGMPGQVKLLTDRLLSMMNTYRGQRPPEDGGSFHGIRGGKTNGKFAVISACAYSESDKVFEPLIKQYDRICGEDGYVAIFCPQLKTLADLGAGPRIDRYEAKFRAAGREFAETGSLCEETLSRLKKPPFSEETYKLLLDKFWEAQKK